MYCPEDDDDRAARQGRKEEDHREGSGHEGAEMVGVTQEEGDKEADYSLWRRLKGAVK